MGGTPTFGVLRIPPLPRPLPHEGGGEFAQRSRRPLRSASASFAVDTRLAPSPLAVEVTNASEPVLCAEKDNVTLNLASKDVRRFRIEAAHPSYIGTIQRDSFEADWTGCTAAGDPKAGPPQPPKRTTLYEEIELLGGGADVRRLLAAGRRRPCASASRVEKGVHLLQVWMIRPMGGEEVLVLYPQDGYWRLRPMAPAGMAPTAFGSSFLIGPVEIDGRPIVRIKEVAFDPKTRTFTLAFERGGSATVRMATTDQNSKRAGCCVRQACRRPPVRGAALHVRHRVQQRRRPHRRAREGRARAGARTASWPSSAPPPPTSGPGARRRRGTTPAAPDMVFSAFADGRDSGSQAAGK